MSDYHESLPKFGDKYLQYFNKDLEIVEIRRKSTKEGNLSLTEAMEVISKFLQFHQLEYIPHGVDKSLFIFPFMFNQFSEGDKLINLATNETYTIEDIIINPDTDKWEGVTKISYSNLPPDPSKREKLVLETNDKYVKFDHLMPAGLINYPTANMEGIINNPPQIAPTITWTLNSMQPGSLDKIGGSRRELKPRLRDKVRDPLVKGYSVEIFGQYFDSIVEFGSWSNDHRTSERLINWFINFLEMYAPYIKQCGVAQMLFQERNNDALSTRWRQTFYGRNVNYFFRTEQLIANYEKDLSDINIILGVDINNDIENRMNKERRYIAGQEITGKITYQEYRDLFYRSGQYLFGDLEIEQ